MCGGAAESAMQARSLTQRHARCAARQHSSPEHSQPQLALCHAAALPGSHLVLLYSRLAHGARAAVALHLQPPVEAGPAVEVAAERHHRLRC